MITLYNKKDFHPKIVLFLLDLPCLSHSCEQIPHFPMIISPDPSKSVAHQKSPIPPSLVHLLYVLLANMKGNLHFDPDDGPPTVSHCSRISNQKYFHLIWKTLHNI